MPKVELEKEKQGKHYKVDIRKVRPLERAGGNIRTDYGDILELAKSIAINGVIVPFRGFRISDDPKFEWESIDGHRRTKACQLLITEGVEIEGKLVKPETVMVPFITVDARTYSDIDMIVDMVATNSGKALSPLELCTAVMRLKDLELSPIEIGNRLSMTTHQVRNFILLASAPKRVRDLISSNQIAYTTALDFLKTSIDFNDAVEKIERALGDVEKKSAEKGTGTGKITRKELKEQNHTVDSFQELKRVFKEQIDNPSTVKNNDLYFFAKMIVENKYTAKDFRNRFFQ